MKEIINPGASIAVPATGPGFGVFFAAGKQPERDREDDLLYMMSHWPDNGPGSFEGVAQGKRIYWQPLTSDMVEDMRTACSAMQGIPFSRPNVEHRWYFVGRDGRRVDLKRNMIEYDAYGPIGYSVSHLAFSALQHPLEVARATLTERSTTMPPLDENDGPIYGPRVIAELQRIHGLRRPADSSPSQEGSALDMIVFCALGAALIALLAGWL